MQVSRALLGAGTVLLLVYLVAIVSFLMLPTTTPESIVPADGTVRYAVTTGAGETHVIDHPVDDPAGVLDEASRRFGEVTSVTRLEPGTTMPDTGSTSRKRITLLMFASLLFPIGLLAAGFYARERSQQTRRLWTAIANTLTADAATLQRQLGINEAGLQSVIARLNAEGRAQLIWDPQTKRVYDRRLSDHTITVQFCPRCNDPINARVIADLQHVPQCSSCMYPVDRHELDRLKANIVQGLRSGSDVETDDSFSMGLFVVLTLVFPPGAIFYGLRHA